MRQVTLSLLVALSACASDDGATNSDASGNGDGFADTSTDAASRDAIAASDAQDGGAPCTTRISYGAAWLHPPNHPASFDDESGLVTWDGACVDDGPSSYAVLSNGFKPYFSGHSACIIALDSSSACAAPQPCATRVTYGASWLPPPNHSTSYDDVPGRLYSDGICHGAIYADLSNGWQPHFNPGACPLSFRYTQCGGLYTNPVIPTDCPDPGVTRDGNQWVLTCTSGNAADALPIYTSTNLVNWALAGHVFPAGKHPSWAVADFWAPEIHHVGTHFVAYFSARHTDGVLSVGAASANSALGPYTDLGAPLIHDPNMGLIDASEFTSSAKIPYVLWKEDGNAKSKPTPIHSQQLAPDGLSLVGNRATLITNDLGWEGTVTEGPFMVEHAGEFFLFYSGGFYANASYAVGVARGNSPLAAMTKFGNPILATSGNAWVGPGHCSVVDTPVGETAMIYHAWKSGCVNGPFCGRDTLVDRVVWDGSGWPSVPLSPSSTTRPQL